MKTVRVVVVICAVFAFFMPAVSAQPPAPKPGPEHERLKQLEGTWEATVRSEGGESKGTMTYKMDLGGLWLVSDFKGEFAGQNFQGKGFDGYDPIKKKYVGVWVDSMTATPLLGEGTFDKEGKVLTHFGEAPGMDGKMSKYKSIIEIKDHDTMMFTMSSPDKEGKDQPMLTIMYKRKK